MTKFLLLCAIYCQSIMHGVDPRIVTAMCYVESSFRPGVVNGQCVGLMQINVPVWRKQLNLDERRLLEPWYNLDKGLDILCIYLKRAARCTVHAKCDKLQKTCKVVGDLDTALLWYNCGPSGKYKSDYVGKVKAAYKIIYGREYENQNR